jgi:hypothetical protein
MRQEHGWKRRRRWPPVRIAMSCSIAAIAEARRLDGSDLQAAPHTVYDKRGQSLAFDLFCDDDQRLAGLHYGFEQR